MAATRVHNFTLVVVSAVTGRDAIGWNGKAHDVAHSPTLCIDPPPFGHQCTLHLGSALAACMQTASCHSMTCPSPEPYTTRKRADGITGPVCQLRSVTRAQNANGAQRERAHGMCKPSACTNFFLEHVMWRPPSQHALRDLVSRARDACKRHGYRHAVAHVLLPDRFESTVHQIVIGELVNLDFTFVVGYGELTAAPPPATSAGSSSKRNGGGVVGGAEFAGKGGSFRAYALCS